MALHLTFDPPLVPLGNAFATSGRRQVTVTVDERGTLTDIDAIERIEFRDTAHGLFRLLPPERLVSRNSQDTGIRGDVWRGRYPPPVRRADEKDAADRWVYQYETGFEWGREVELTCIAYDADGVELDRATVGPIS